MVKVPSKETLKNRYMKHMNKLTKLVRKSTIGELWRYYNGELEIDEYIKYKKNGLIGLEDLLLNAFEHVMEDKMNPLIRDNMITKLSNIVKLKHKHDKSLIIGIDE